MAKHKDLEDHAKSAKHKKSAVGVKSARINQCFPAATSSHKESVKRAELHLALHIAEHGSNASVDHLGESGSVPGISYYTLIF